MLLFEFRILFLKDFCDPTFTLSISKDGMEKLRNMSRNEEALGF